MRKYLIILTLGSLLVATGNVVCYAETPLGWRGNSFYKTDEDRYEQTKTKEELENEKKIEENKKKSLVDIIRNIALDIAQSTGIGDVLSKVGSSSTGSTVASGNSSTGSGITLSDTTERWRELVEEEAKKQGASYYVPLAMAMIEVETKGTGTRDIMQSSESAGFPRNYYKTEEASVKQGISYIMSCVNSLKSAASGIEKDLKAVAQTYNFGGPFAKYVGTKGEFNIEVAESYSRDILAPALGNTTGQTYGYVNETSIRVGKQYLYLNGGNFMYHEKIAMYL